MWAGCFEGYGQTPCADEWNEDVSHPSSWVEGFQHLGQQPTRHFPGDPSGGAAITVLHVEESEDVCVASKNAPRHSLLSLWYYSTTTTTIFTQTQRIIDNHSLRGFPVRFLLRFTSKLYGSIKWSARTERDAGGWWGGRRYSYEWRLLCSTSGQYGNVQAAVDSLNVNVK